MKKDNRVIPGKGTPMRQWAAPSYDPATGRSHSSVDEQSSRDHVSHGNHAKPAVQAPTAFHKLDKQRTQNPTPVRKRPLG
jgi:hypothetical protein